MFFLDENGYVKNDIDLVNSLSKDGESCLMLAAVPDSMDLVQLLMRRGGDINERASGETVSTRNMDCYEYR